MANKSSHPSPEVLSLFHDKEGDQQLLKDLQEHVDKCAECRSRLLVMGKLSTELENLPNMPAPESVMEAVQHVTRTQPVGNTIVSDTAPTDEVPRVVEVKRRPQWPARVAALLIIGACLGAFWHFESNKQGDMKTELARSDSAPATAASDDESTKAKRTLSRDSMDLLEKKAETSDTRSPFRQAPTTEGDKSFAKSTQDEKASPGAIESEFADSEAPRKKRAGSEQMGRVETPSIKKGADEDSVALATPEEKETRSRGARKQDMSRSLDSGDSTAARRKSKNKSTAPSSKGLVGGVGGDEDDTLGKVDEEIDQESELSAEPTVSEVSKEEQARFARERAEAERIAEEKAEAERIAREKELAERVAREKAEADARRRQAEREEAAREQAVLERIAREKAAREAEERRVAELEAARKKAEAERLAREKAERERIAREKAEKERLAREAAAKRAREAVAKLRAESRVQAVATEKTPAADGSNFLVLYGTPDNLKKLEDNLRGWLEPERVKQIAAYAGSEAPETSIDDLRALLGQDFRAGPPDEGEPSKSALDVQLTNAQYQVLLRLALSPVGVTPGDLARAVEGQSDEDERVPVRIALVE